MFLKYKPYLYKEFEMTKHELKEEVMERGCLEGNFEGWLEDLMDIMDISNNKDVRFNSEFFEWCLENWV